MDEKTPEEIPDNERIWLLTPSEFEVAWYKTIGMKRKDIAKKLHTAPSTISSHIRNMYQSHKLDIKDKDARKREDEFKERYQYIIFSIVDRKEELDEKDIKTFEVEQDKFEEKKRRQAIEKERQKEEVFETPKAAPSENQVRKELEELESRMPPPPEPRNRWQMLFGQRWFIQLLVGIIVGLALIVVSVGLVNALTNPQPDTPLAFTQPTATVEIETNLPLSSRVETATRRAELTDSSFTFEKTQALQTATLTAVAVDPTLPPTPTDILFTKTPKPPFVIFEDKFEGAIQETLNLVSGEYSVINGTLVAESEVVFIVGEKTWQDYVVIARIKADKCWGEQANAIGVYAQDPNNMIAFGFGACIRALFEVENGQWREITDSRYTIPGEFDFFDIRITSEAEQIYVADGGKIKINYVSLDRQSGMVYLKLGKGSSIDFLMVTHLPGY